MFLMLENLLLQRMNLLLSNENRYLHYLMEFSGDFYYLLSGSKVYSMPSLYTDDYYTMPTLLPFVNNEITLLEGSVTSLTVIKNSRIRE